LPARLNLSIRARRCPSLGQACPISSRPAGENRRTGTDLCLYPPTTPDICFLGNPAKAGSRNVLFLLEVWAAAFARMTRAVTNLPLRRSGRAARGGVSFPRDLLPPPSRFRAHPCAPAALAADLRAGCSAEEPGACPLRARRSVCLRRQPLGPRPAHLCQHAGLRQVLLHPGQARQPSAARRRLPAPARCAPSLLRVQSLSRPCVPCACPPYTFIRKQCTTTPPSPSGTSPALKQGEEPA